MYAKRIIPCLDVKNGRVVKGEIIFSDNIRCHFTDIIIGTDKCHETGDSGKS